MTWRAYPYSLIEPLTNKGDDMLNSVGDVYSDLPTEMPADEKYFRIAMLALNMNTLLGSISESFLTVIKRNAGIDLKDMDWDPELPATALPMIERRALANSRLPETRSVETHNYLSTQMDLIETEVHNIPNFILLLVPINAPE